MIRGLADGNQESYTQLFENSKLEVVKLSADSIDTLSEVYLDLILGEVLINVEGLTQTSSFQVATPNAVAGVRGTTFSVQVLYNTVARIYESRFLVLKGKLGITPGRIYNFRAERQNYILRSVGC